MFQPSPPPPFLSSSFFFITILCLLHLLFRLLLIHLSLPSPPPPLIPPPRPSLPPHSFDLEINPLTSLLHNLISPPTSLSPSFDLEILSLPHLISILQHLIPRPPPPPPHCLYLFFLVLFLNFIFCIVHLDLLVFFPPFSSSYSSSTSSSSSLSSYSSFPSHFFPFSSPNIPIVVAVWLIPMMQGT